MPDATQPASSAGPQDREERLKAVLFREETQARSWQDGELTTLRQDSLKYYQRDPVGDEEPGQSQVVTSEYQDTVESMMPALLRVFTSGESVVEFAPDNPGDEQFAKEASDYIPHVVMRENEGFVWFTWFIKDALMYRLAWGAVDLEEVEQVKSKSFGPVPQDAFALLEQQATQMAEQVGADLTIEAETDPQSSMVSGKLTTKRKVKKVRLDNIAPEDGLVSPIARHVDEASFAGYRKAVTASELKIMGLDEDTIRSLSTDDLYTPEQAQRQPDVMQAATERDNRDDSERQLWVVVAYVRFDWDDDGISEMRRVLYAHAGGQVRAIIENEEWTDGVAPIIPGTPILMSHTIPGRSIFDQVKDLQDIGTAVTRGMLDNMYLVSRPRPAVSDQVDLASLIDWTPGMPIRMRQGSKVTPEDLQWLQVPPVMDKTLAIIQWKDEVLQRRTGVTPNSQGVLDENMNPTAMGAALATSAADARVELIARTLAETAIKRLYRLVYRAVKRAATGPITYRPDDEWVTVDPTKWPDDMALEVNIGMGAGNKSQQIQNVMLMGQGQQALTAAYGGTVVKPQHAANTYRKLLQTMGVKSTDQYVSSDQDITQSLQQQAQNPPPNPELIKAQATAQAEQAKAQSVATQAQAENVRSLAEAKATQEKNQQDAFLKQQELNLRERELALKQDQLAADSYHKEQDRQLKREQMQHDADKHAATVAHQNKVAGINAAQKRSELDAAVDGEEPDEMDRQTREVLQQLAQATTQQAQATQNLGAGLEKLAESMNSETEITTSRGTTARARKVPRQ